jgi:CelD/BcsL family acetyltransferase involved in cellulose biosynthesis
VIVTAYHHNGIFEELRPEWNDLVRKSTTDTIFCTWEWQSTWWDSYKEDGDLWIVTCRVPDGRLVGIGSWFIHHLDGERVVRAIGCVDVTDYLDIIADKDCVYTVHECLSDFLLQHREQYDRISLCNIPEASPTCDSFSKQLIARGFEVEVSLQEVCPIIRLPSDWESYLEGLDKKNRHEIRRKLRRAEETEIERILVNESHNFDDMAAQFMALMCASHPLKAQFLEDEKNAKFFRSILSITFARNWLKLTFLRISGKLTAAYCDFDYNGHILVYNSGLLPEESSHLSPGIVLLAYNIRDAIETNHTVFDFLRGDENYKYRMGAQDTKVFQLKAQ